MTKTSVKFLAITLFVIPVLFVIYFSSETVKVSAVNDDDPAAVYKAKCAMCHSPAAAKFFDTAKTDEELVKTILEGKKGEKPPYMPAYAAKGITAEQAQALVAHMRQLKAPPAEE